MAHILIIEPVQHYRIQMRKELWRLKHTVAIKHTAQSGRKAAQNSYFDLVITFTNLSESKFKGFNAEHVRALRAENRETLLLSYVHDLGTPWAGRGTPIGFVNLGSNRHMTLQEGNWNIPNLEGEVASLLGLRITT